MRQVTALEGGRALDEALALFDRCSSVTCEEMIGPWRGSGMPTGHPMDGLLEATGWHGKRFDGLDDVHPLLFDGPRGQVLDVDPVRLPMTLAMRVKPLVQSRFGRRAAPRVLPLLRTSKPTARLRMMACRGVVTATMSYDARPINDHFRRVDDDTMLGLMDLRGTPPFFFVLRRKGQARSAPRPAGGVIDLTGASRSGRFKTGLNPDGGATSGDEPSPTAKPLRNLLGGTDVEFSPTFDTR